MQKYQREIEEILEKLDQSPPSGRVLTPVRPLAPAPPPRRPRVSLSFRATPSTLMIAALTLAVLSSPMQWIYPPAVAVVGVIAVGLLVLSLVMSVARLGRPSSAPMWRGRPVESPSGGIAGGIRRRWRRWKAHRRFRDPRWN